jgi:hypothetical protein
MALYDIKQVSLTLSGRTIGQFVTDADAINFRPSADLGKYTPSVDGEGVWVANPDGTGILIIKLKQESSDNAYLSQQMALQKTQIKSFTPMSLQIRDLLNNDLVSASNGFFTTVPPYARGGQHNATAWAIEFNGYTMSLIGATSR